MIKVGLTGNRYSGKNKVCKIFSQMSIPVFDADLCVKFLFNHNFELQLKLQKKLSSDFFDTDGYFNPKKITTPAIGEALDLIEPELFSLFNKFCDKQKQSIYCIFKSSIIFEKNWSNKFDYLINVFAPSNYRVDRCMKLTGKKYSDIYDFSKSELSDETKNKRSKFVIHCYDGAPDLIKSINQVDTAIIEYYLNIKYKQKIFHTYDRNL